MEYLLLHPFKPGSKLCDTQSQEVVGYLFVGSSLPSLANLLRVCGILFGARSFLFCFGGRGQFR